MKKMIAALFVVLLFSCTGCSIQIAKETLPEETVEEFEDAVNAMDVNAMMDCMDEDAVKTMTAGLDIVLKIAGKASGLDLDIDAETLLSAFPLFSGFVSMEGSEEIPEMDLQVTKTLIKGKKATVYVLEANSGKSMAMNLKKDDGEWKITLDVVPVKEEEADRVILPGEEDAEETTEIGDITLSQLFQSLMSGKQEDSDSSEDSGRTASVAKSLLNVLLGD